MKNKIIKKKFPIRKTIYKEETKAALSVLKKGVLSSFVATFDNNLHNGGEYVKKFEEKIKSYFKVKYALTANSWTSGLIMAVGALNIEPGDEIILPTWTMSVAQPQLSLECYTSIC